MRKHTVTLIAGDGSGPELVAAARTVLDTAAGSAGFHLDWDVRPAGQGALRSVGELLPASTLDSIRRNGVALKGPTTTPIGVGHRSVNITIRRELDLYACVRPVRVWPGAGAVDSGIDVVVVRENTEDVYSGLEYPADSDGAAAVSATLSEFGHADPGIAFSLKPITPGGSRRIVAFALDHARKNGRRKVEVGADVYRYPRTEGLFFEAARELGPEYPDIVTATVPVTVLCDSLVRDPADRDVLVLPNLYGDVISDVTAALVGGLGMAPGANIGDRTAVFEATHGSAPEFAGSNRLNPTALILSGCMLLDHLGEAPTAARIRAAVRSVLEEGRSVTFDLLPPDRAARAVTTTAYAEAVIERLRDIG
ncbi:isocitrate/isopropylmalate dehydrogenase family protein [Streptomyces sp. Y1]|uniref:Isocitrate/isopropylmalate dehydrogenase family protein n=1 Tax=Streptomyces sp. Y1 TaxID=3238634 RepID=A0AB39TTU2_9ACTN